MKKHTHPRGIPAMPSDEEVNKRLYLRLPRPYPVELKMLSFPMPTESIKTNCCDISRGGVCLEANQPFSVGAAYQLRILIPLLNKFSPGFFRVYENDMEQYFVAVGEVVWAKPAGGRYLIGIKFANVDGDQGIALDRLIKKAFAPA